MIMEAKSVLVPDNVIWDITYSCPLRCVHCYSESGRRPSRQLGMADLLRVTEAIISLRPQGVALAGGEPLLVGDVFEVAGRLTRASIPVMLYTGGWLVEERTVRAAAEVNAKIVVSIDGATADVHDRIRGRAGSFTRALRALSILDHSSREARERGLSVPSFGIDFVVMASNLDQMEMLCTDVVPIFSELKSLSFNVVAPAGLASRQDFGQTELLTDEQADFVGSTEQQRRLQALVPSSVMVTTTDNRFLRMHPDQIACGAAFATMQVEPDGEVRAMPMYEGTVGSLLHEPAETLWRRAIQRWSDPFVVTTLRTVRTMSDWAEATRRLDRYFGSPAVLQRIAQRPEYQPNRPIEGPTA
jgi:MoaA/NifB/PqqE/SkfB family radical SAM enzyme